MNYQEIRSLFLKRSVHILIWTLLISSLGYGVSIAGTVTVKPSVRIEESYDSNATLGSNSDKGDFLTSVAPRIDMFNERKGLVLNGSYSLSSKYYSRESGLNYISHFGQVGAKMDISGSYSVSISDSVTYTRDSREADATGIQLPLSGILTNNISLALNHKWSPLTTVTVRGSDSFSKYDESSFIDSRTDTAGVDLSRQLTSMTSANVSYTFTNSHFERSGGNDVQSHSFQLGASNNFFSDLSLNLSGGVVYSGEIGDKYDWTAQAGLSKRFQMSSVTASYSRGVSAPSGLTDEITISDRGALAWSQTLSKTLGMVLSGSYSESHSEPTSLLWMKSYTASISTDWRPNPWLSFGAGYSRSQQWAEGPLGNDSSGDRVYVSVTAAADGWRY